jgi:3-isopropylmalate dehydrogenase
MKIAVLNGDGVSAEVVPAALEILMKLQTRDLRFDFAESPIGGAAMDLTGDPLPPETLALAKNADAIILGAVGTPAYEALAKTRPGRGLIRLRRELGLFANLRPVRVFPELVAASPLKPELLAGADLLVVRELSGGLYYGTPRGRIETSDGQRESVNTMRYTEAEIARVAHVAFRAARQRRKKLCSVDKANVLETMALWREVVTEVGREYPDVALRHLYMDAAAMALVQAPAQFDVIVCGNLFGDILSDEAAVLGGSIGMLPSASLGEGRKGLYEPIHGSAPDIAGKDIANPIGTILSAAMMLRLTFDLEEPAARIEAAVDSVLKRGLRTRDIATPGTTVVGTRAMGHAILEAL